MPPHSQARTGVEIDHATHTIRFVRSFDAPADLVFKAWTGPEHVRCWWDAAGEPLAICEIDLRPGGAFRFVSRAHPEMPFTGVYLEIAQYIGLAYQGYMSHDTDENKDIIVDTTWLEQMMTRYLEHGKFEQGG